VCVFVCVCVCVYVCVLEGKRVCGCFGGVKGGLPYVFLWVVWSLLCLEVIIVHGLGWYF